MLRIIEYKMFHRGYNIVKYADDIFLVHIDCPKYENQLFSNDHEGDENLVKLYHEYMKWYQNNVNLSTVGFCLSDAMLFPQEIMLDSVEDAEYLDVHYNGWRFLCDFQEFITNSFALESKHCYDYVKLLKDMVQE